MIMTNQKLGLICGVSLASLCSVIHAEEPFWVTEGFDTLDLREAKALLEELAG
jgi:hypothetical protein